jgi:hypothetical protein
VADARPTPRSTVDRGPRPCASPPPRARGRSGRHPEPAHHHVAAAHADAAGFEVDPGGAHRHEDAAPVGVRAVDRRPDQQRGGDRAGEASASSERAPRTVMGDPAGPRRRRRPRGRGPRRRPPGHGRPRRCSAAARRSGREQRDGVAGRAVAVDADAVEGRATACRSSCFSTGPLSGASVASTDSSVAIAGSIMPTPLAIPATMHATPSSVTSKATCLHDGVGRQHRLAAAGPPSSRVGEVTGSAQGLEQPVDRQRHPDDPRWTARTSLASTSRSATSRWRQPSASPRSPVQTFALPALITTPARVPVGGVLLGHEAGRRLDEVGGGHDRDVDRFVGVDQREVRLARCP